MLSILDGGADYEQPSAASWGSSTVFRACSSVNDYTDLSAGTVTIFQYGAGQAGVMRLLGKYMLASGSMFGCGKLVLCKRFPTDMPQTLHGHWQYHSK